MRNFTVHFMVTENGVEMACFPPSAASSPRRAVSPDFRVRSRLVVDRGIVTRIDDPDYIESTGCGALYGVQLLAR